VDAHRTVLGTAESGPSHGGPGGLQPSGHGLHRAAHHVPPPL